MHHADGVPHIVGRYRLLGKQLGRGNYAKVEEAIQLDLETHVAIKMIDTATVRDPYVLRNLHREANVLRKLHHPHIVAVFESMHAGPLYCIVTELVGGGELSAFVQRQPRSHLDERTTLLFGAQLIAAVAHMHERGVVHRDLKMKNILLNKAHDAVKIVDYGLSNFWSPSKPLQTHCGSPGYAAPEIYLHGKTYGPEVDLWSLGVVFYGMAVGRMPFPNCKDKNASPQERRKRLLAQISRGATEAHVQAMAHFTPPFRDLVQGLLTASVPRRLTLQQVQIHPWVANRLHVRQINSQPYRLHSREHALILTKLAVMLNMSVGAIEAHCRADKLGEVAAMYNILAQKQLASYHASWGMRRCTPHTIFTPNSLQPPRSAPAALQSKQKRSNALTQPTQLPTGTLAITSTQDSSGSTMQRQVSFTNFNFNKLNETQYNRSLENHQSTPSRQSAENLLARSPPQQSVTSLPQPPPPARLDHKNKPSLSMETVRGSTEQLDMKSILLLSLSSGTAGKASISQEDIISYIKNRSAVNDTQTEKTTETPEVTEKYGTTEKVVENPVKAIVRKESTAHAKSSEKKMVECEGAVHNITKVNESCSSGMKQGGESQSKLAIHKQVDAKEASEECKQGMDKLEVKAVVQKELKANNASRQSESGLIIKTEIQTIHRKTKKDQDEIISCLATKEIKKSRNREAIYEKVNVMSDRVLSRAWRRETDASCQTTLSFHVDSVTDYKTKTYGRCRPAYNIDISLNTIEETHSNQTEAFQKPSYTPRSSLAQSSTGLSTKPRKSVSFSLIGASTVSVGSSIPENRDTGVQADLIQFSSQDFSMKNEKNWTDQHKEPDKRYSDPLKLSLTENKILAEVDGRQQKNNESGPTKEEKDEVHPTLWPKSSGLSFNNPEPTRRASILRSSAPDPFVATRILVKTAPISRRMSPEPKKSIHDVEKSAWKSPKSMYRQFKLQLRSSSSREATCRAEESNKSFHLEVTPHEVRTVPTVPSMCESKMTQASAEIPLRKDETTSTITFEVRNMLMSQESTPQILPLSPTNLETTKVTLDHVLLKAEERPMWGKSPELDIKHDTPKAGVQKSGKPKSPQQCNENVNSKQLNASPRPMVELSKQEASAAKRSRTHAERRGSLNTSTTDAVPSNIKTGLRARKKHKQTLLPNHITNRYRLDVALLRTVERSKKFVDKRRSSTLNTTQTSSIKSVERGSKKSFSRPKGKGSKKLLTNLAHQETRARGVSNTVQSPKHGKSSVVMQRKVAFDAEKNEAGTTNTEYSPRITTNGERHGVTG